MTNDEFLKGLKGEQLAFAQNLLSQRDDTLSRIDKATKDLTTANTSHTTAIQKLNDDNSAATAKLTADHKTQVDVMNTQMNQLQSSHKDELTTVQSKLDAAQKMVDELGGTELGQKMKKEREHQEMMDKKLALEEQLKQLSADLDL